MWLDNLHTYGMLECLSNYTDNPHNPDYDVIVHQCRKLLYCVVTFWLLSHLDNSFQKVRVYSEEAHYFGCSGTRQQPFPVETFPQMHYDLWVFPLVWTFYRKFSHNRWPPYPQAVSCKSRVCTFTSANKILQVGDITWLGWHKWTRECNSNTFMKHQKCRVKTVQ